MDKINQRSFEEHSRNYAQRFADVEGHPHLVFENEVIVSFLQQHLSNDQEHVLVDAACGTGDRLQNLFSKHNLARGLFSKIVGLDYAPGMLQIAGERQLNGSSLYDALTETDLLKAIDIGTNADVVLCLCEVTNTNGKDTKALVANFSQLLNSGGIVVYDMLTTVARKLLKEQEAELLTRHQELSVDDDPQRVWYERPDGTIAHQRLFSPADINDLLRSSDLSVAEVWGYRNKTLKPQRLDISKKEIDEQKAAQFASVLVIQTKT